jgi:hypothetical protein
MMRRRRFLGATAATIGASAIGAGAIGMRRAHAAVGPARNLVLVVAYGGWDTTYVFDPKPGEPGIDAPPGDIAEVGGVTFFDAPTRPAVRSFFESWGERCTIVNGLQVQSLVHADCSKRLLTGTQSDANPDVGAIASFVHGSDRAVPYFVLGQTSYAGPYGALSARAGTANQLGTLIDLRYSYPIEGVAEPLQPDDAEAALVRAHVERRAARIGEVRGRLGDNREKIEAFRASLGRGDVLRSIGPVGDLDYTRDLGVQAGLAVNALERELSWAVQLELGSFDTHDDNALQDPMHQSLFVGLDLLVRSLAERPGRNGGASLLDETVVAVVSEMGRTPLFNGTGGKDHWPVTSAMVLGADLPGGRVLGATTGQASARAIDLTTGAPSDAGVQLQYGNFAAGLLAAVGVEPSDHLPNVEAFHALRPG